MLKRVSIQNFKSLKDVTLDLQKVNLLIGPNNSGKTNFLKSFEFSSNYVDGEDKQLLNDIFFNRDSSPNFLIHYVFDNDLPSTWEENKDFYEHLLIENDGEYKFREIRLGQAHWGYSETVNSEIAFFDDMDTTKSLYRYAVGFTVIYNIDPWRIKFAYPLLPNNSIIYGDGENIVPFLDTLRDKYPDNFYQIQESLSFCIPEFTQIRFDTIEPNENLKTTFGDKTFKKLGLYNKVQKQTYWADELSEGTLYFLALLCIINQPNPPKLLLLEEPEKGIHPRRIWEVMKFIFQLAEEKDVQIILTTHNEHVINAFSSIPEAVS